MMNDAVAIKHGVEVFTQMKNNLHAVMVSLGMNLRKMSKQYPVLLEVSDSIKKVFASSSTNTIYDGTSIFKDENALPSHSKEVIEIYFKWDDLDIASGEFSPTDFVITLSANAGTNTIDIGIGYGDKNDPRNSEGFQKAITKVVGQTIQDMDMHITEEENLARKNIYANIISKEINKKAKTIFDTNKSLAEIKLSDVLIMKVKEAECVVEKLSEKYADAHPVRVFEITVKDDTGVPFFSILSELADNNNSDLYIKYFVDAEWTDYVCYRKDKVMEPYGELVNNVYIPAIKRVFPDLEILQENLIKQTTEAISKNIKA